MTTTEQSVGNSRFNEEFGPASERATLKLKTHLTPYIQEFVRAAPFAVMATTDGEGRCDASPKGGKPGFVKVLDEKRLLFPDVAGNRLFQSYQNIDANPQVGLVFMIPGNNDTVRVNGKATIISQDELAQRNVEVALHDPDERSHHLQGILIEVEEAYTHCPRAFKFSKLWDPEEIKANQTTRTMPDKANNI